MAEAYDRLRSLPLLDVLLALGWDASAFKVRKQGTEFSGKCPIHGGKTNNTAFNFARDGKWHCFSCDAKGKGAIDLVMAVKGVGFQAAVAVLQGLEPVSSPRAEYSGPQPSASAVEEAKTSENPPFRSTYDKYKVPSEWLQNRGLESATLDHYEVFQYHNPARRSTYSGSVMLKIRRYSDGECVGYLSRNITQVTPDKPKYVFPKGFQKGRELFGAWQIKDDEQKLRVLYVVESPFCVMAFHQKGIPAISPFGWSLSDQQIEIIKQLTKGVIYLPDADKSREIADSLRRLSIHVWVKSPPLPDGITDPEQLTLEQIKQLA